MNIVTTVIKSRHSVRKFKPETVSDIVIKDVLECAAQAPTAMNIQPWLFGVIKNKDVLVKIAAITEHGKFIAESPLCFAVFGEKKETYYLEDCCAATENIILALQAHGFTSCWVAGDKKAYGEQIRDLLGVPVTYTLVSLIAAGIPAEILMTPKKELAKIVFHDNFKKE
ncbi:MAG: nitroreductase family protein [Methanoregula sp.]|nr:nitroreductase family protein [Methanoregula sp.]